MKKNPFIVRFTLLIGLILVLGNTVDADIGRREKKKKGIIRKNVERAVGVVKTYPVVVTLPEPEVVNEWSSEKGDPIYRRLDLSKLFRWIDIAYLNNPTHASMLKKLLREQFAKVGHTGLYHHWEPDEFSDPTITANHKTIESDITGPSYHNFGDFLKSEDFWGVRTSDKLDYKKRQKIIESAESQIDNPDVGYNFFEGYKSEGVSFRCDGLVEWAYEKVGIDIVPNPDWWCVRKGHNFLCANIQMRNLQKQRSAALPLLTFGRKSSTKDYGPIEIAGKDIPPVGGSKKYRVHGDKVKVKVYASDIKPEPNDGSGIARIELWVGKPGNEIPDKTPKEMPGLRLDRKDNPEHPMEYNYTYTWNVTKKDKQDKPLFPNGTYTLKAIAFDQAGNKKEATLPVEVAKRAKYRSFNLKILGRYGKVSYHKDYSQARTIAWNQYTSGTYKFVNYGAESKSLGTRLYSNQFNKTYSLFILTNRMFVEFDYPQKLVLQTFHQQYRTTYGYPDHEADSYAKVYRTSLTGSESLETLWNDETAEYLGQVHLWDLVWNKCTPVAVLDIPDEWFTPPKARFHIRCTWEFDPEGPNPFLKSYKDTYKDYLFGYWCKQSIQGIYKE